MLLSDDDESDDHSVELDAVFFLSLPLSYLFVRLFI